MSQLAQTFSARPSRARLAGTLLVALLSASALVWIGRAAADEVDEPAGALAAVSNVATGRADAVDDLVLRCTSSGSFVDMPGMSETFRFGGDVSRPVLVLFQGEWQNSSFEGDAAIRLTIDGVAQPGRTDGVFVHEDDEFPDFETNGFNFISAPLAPGTHTATIQWKSLNGTICVAWRSVIVLHK
jgi:hypothetical protein